MWLPGLQIPAFVPIDRRAPQGPLAPSCTQQPGMHRAALRARAVACRGGAAACCARARCVSAPAQPPAQAAAAARGAALAGSSSRRARAATPRAAAGGEGESSLDAALADVAQAVADASAHARVADGEPEPAEDEEPTGEVLPLRDLAIEVEMRRCFAIIRCVSAPACALPLPHELTRTARASGPVCTPVLRCATNPAVAAVTPTVRACHVNLYSAAHPLTLPSRHRSRQDDADGEAAALRRRHPRSRRSAVRRALALAPLLLCARLARQHPALMRPCATAPTERGAAAATRRRIGWRLSASAASASPPRPCPSPTAASC
jgi:hypothetical protein